MHAEVCPLAPLASALVFSETLRVVKIPSRVTTREPGAARTYGGHIEWYNRAAEGSLPADLSQHAPREVAA